MDTATIYWISVLDVLKPVITITLILLICLLIGLIIGYSSYENVYKKRPFSFGWIILCSVISLLLYFANIFIPSSQSYATMVLTQSLQSEKNINPEEYKTLIPLMNRWIRDISGDWNYGKQCKDK